MQHIVSTFGLIKYTGSQKIFQRLNSPFQMIIHLWMIGAVQLQFSTQGRLQAISEVRSKGDLYLMLTGILCNLTISLMYNSANLSKEYFILIGRKWADLVSRSTTTHIESKPFCVFGKPNTNPLQYYPISKRGFPMIVVYSPISNVQSWLSGKPNNLRRTKLSPFSFLTTKTSFLNPDTSLSYQGECSCYSYGPRLKYLSSIPHHKVRIPFLYISSLGFTWTAKFLSLKSSINFIFRNINADTCSDFPLNASATTLAFSGWY